MHFVLLDLHQNWNAFVSEALKTVKDHSGKILERTWAYVIHLMI